MRLICVRQKVLKMVNRNSVIEATMRALASTPEFEEAGLTYEMMDEIHTRLENLPKDDPNKIRKRSAARGEKKAGVEEGPKRIRGGYQVCDHKEHGSEEFRAKVKAYMVDNPDKKYMSAKGDVWKLLSAEEIAVFEKKAEEVNEQNGFAAKEAKKSSPTVTKAQMEEQNRLMKEALEKAGMEESIPDLPEREPPKPRKKKSSASNSEESVSPPKSPVSESEMESLSTMVQSVVIDSDSDEDDDESTPCVKDDFKEWCKMNGKNMIENDGVSNSTAEFLAWVMYMNPETYGPDKLGFVPKEQAKEAKKLHNLKERKNDPSAPWVNFLA